MKWTAIILAAGASQRMGRPKALIPIGEHTFLTRLVKTFREAGAADVVVVVGAHAHEVRSSNPPCVVHENSAWVDGQLSSALSGLRRGLVTAPDALMLHPVDAPRIQAATVSALLGHLPSTVIAAHRGIAGHPIALTAASARVLLSTTARTLAEALATLHPGLLEVGDPAVLENFNDPAAWAQAQVAGG